MPAKNESIQSTGRGYRGRKARTVLTQAEINFCAYFVLTGNVKQASLQAGYSAWWGYELLKMPRIQPVLREFEKRKREEAWDQATCQIAVTTQFLDEQFISRLVSMKTHPKVGHMPIVKMLETGYKRTGDIQTTKVTNMSSSVVAGLQGSPTMEQTIEVMYKPKWLRDKEEALKRKIAEKLEREADLLEKKSSGE
jgi:phage terminase small subunit